MITFEFSLIIIMFVDNPYKFHKFDMIYYDIIIILYHIMILRWFLLFNNTLKLNDYIIYM